MAANHSVSLVPPLPLPLSSLAARVRKGPEDKKREATEAERLPEVEFDSENCYTVWAAGRPGDYSRLQLREYFQQYGELEGIGVRFPPPPDNESAFCVDFRTLDGALTAMRALRHLRDFPQRDTVELGEFDWHVQFGASTIQKIRLERQERRQQRKQAAAAVADDKAPNHVPSPSVKIEADGGRQGRGQHNGGTPNGTSVYPTPFATPPQTTSPHGSKAPPSIILGQPSPNRPRPKPLQVPSKANPRSSTAKAKVAARGGRAATAAAAMADDVTEDLPYPTWTEIAGPRAKRGARESRRNRPSRLRSEAVDKQEVKEEKEEKEKNDRSRSRRRRALVLEEPSEPERSRRSTNRTPSLATSRPSSVASSPGLPPGQNERAYPQGKTHKEWMAHFAVKLYDYLRHFCEKRSDLLNGEAVPQWLSYPSGWSFVMEGWGADHIEGTPDWGNIRTYKVETIFYAAAASTAAGLEQVDPELVKQFQDGKFFRFFVTWSPGRVGHTRPGYGFKTNIISKAIAAKQERDAKAAASSTVNAEAGEVRHGTRHRWVLKAIDEAAKTADVAPEMVAVPAGAEDAWQLRSPVDADEKCPEDVTLSVHNSRSIARSPLPGMTSSLG
ncbi:unnamed protein product [Vitrella brassicaformis CCMP3155]|uniref:RRM domain-containing protein n=1 Tax=Vitrella brassicaformis (strain CCMP3155) TaxID=1169540 RepID=A0A0G4F1E4_VITBC|nr:unnamed protein product [Vitrella brassicaformis CCMP3155]|eukprot:CEM05717.1 unnamed protein product [Vitrella brassicaformis CCMP3155]